MKHVIKQKEQNTTKYLLPVQSQTSIVTHAVKEAAQAIYLIDAVDLTKNGASCVPFVNVTAHN